MKCHIKPGMGDHNDAAPRCSIPPGRKEKISFLLSNRFWGGWDVGFDLHVSGLLIERDWLIGKELSGAFVGKTDILNVVICLKQYTLCRTEIIRGTLRG